jgi:hypothetical protein
MKRLIVYAFLLVPLAPMAGCSGAASHGASEATEKALEIRNEKRADVRGQMLKSHQPGRRGAGAHGRR